MMNLITDKERTRRETLRDRLSPQVRDAIDQKVIEACEAGYKRELLFLLEEGGSPNAKSENGTPALILTNWEGCAYALMDAGADLWLRGPDGLLPIIHHLYRGNKSIADTIKQYMPTKDLEALQEEIKKAEDYLKGKKSRWQALRHSLPLKARIVLDQRVIEAAEAGHKRLLSSILAEGGSPNAKNRYGYPALVLTRWERCAFTLLRAGADPFAKTPDGKLPFMHHIYEGNLHIADAIRQYMTVKDVENLRSEIANAEAYAYRNGYWNTRRWIKKNLLGPTP